MVSIIIPYIDEHEYLAEAIASAIVQEDVSSELIVVCNATTMPAGYKPIPGGIQNARFIHQPIPGSAYARNAGLEAASGEWVQFLDVDDLLCPDKIKNQLKSQDADVVVSPHTYVYTNGTHENSKWIKQDIWCGLLDSGLGSTSSMLWKRRALLEAGGWSLTYQSHQEYELLFRLAVAGKKIVPVDGFETIVRQRNSGSITSTSKPVRVLEGIQLREQMWEHLTSHQMDNPARYDAFRQYIFRQLRGLFRQDKKMAMSYFNKYFLTHPFSPLGIPIPGYNYLYRWLGFNATESMIKIFIPVKKVLSFGK